MKLQDLLEVKDIDITKAKLMRHNLSNPEIAKNHETRTS